MKSFLNLSNNIMTIADIIPAKRPDRHSDIKEANGMLREVNPFSINSLREKPMILTTPAERILLASNILSPMLIFLSLLKMILNAFLIEPHICLTTLKIFLKVPKKKSFNAVRNSDNILPFMFVQSFLMI